MVYRLIDDNKNIFGLRWLCQKFGIILIVITTTKAMQSENIVNA